MAQLIFEGGVGKLLKKKSCTAKVEKKNIMQNGPREKNRANEKRGSVKYSCVYYYYLLFFFF